MTWDPKLYLTFGDERLRPALDLLARVPSDAPTTVYDLGCGPGTVTQVLTGRWPGARVVGVDSSPDMLARAPQGDVSWVQADLGAWTPDAPADLVYSNAALHWLDDHAALFPRLMGMLNPGGVLAVQMPNNFLAPSHTCLIEAAKAGAWEVKVLATLRPSPVAAPDVYYDLLAPLCSTLDIWQTEYVHVLDGDNPVVDWTRGTVLRPLLDAAGDHADGFLAAYAALIEKAYPPRADGKTLFAFKRLFVVARA